MRGSTGNTGYGRTAILLHWLVAVFLVLQFAAAWTMEVEDGPGPAGAIANFHATLGVTIAILALVRLFNRVANPVAQLANIPIWQQRAAEAVHWALLLLLIAMPVAGILTALDEGADFVLFGVIPLPQFAAPESALTEFGHEAHEIGATVFLILIGLHAAAALYHHFIRRDEVLKRMLP